MKRSITIALALLLVAAFAIIAPNPVQAEDESPSGNWADHANIGWYVSAEKVDGKFPGSEANPYIISTAEELAGLALLVNADADYFTYTTDNSDGKTIYTITGFTNDEPAEDSGILYDTCSIFNKKYIKLSDDVDEIDLSAHNWTPIGGENQFRGNFDGSEKTITGLTMIYDEVDTDFYAGLFGRIYSASLTNITLANVNIDIANSATQDDRYALYVGSVLGRCFSGGVKLENCKVSSGSIKTTGDNSTRSYVGGVAGDINNATLDNCDNGSSVTMEYLAGTLNPIAYCGGVFGYGNNITASYCDNTGKVTNWIAGGIGGVCNGKNGTRDNYSTITNCTNNGDVDSGDVGAFYPTESSRMGGIIGDAGWTIISNCTNSGDVTARAKDSIDDNSSMEYVEAGGIVGYGSLVVLDGCSNSGNVSAIANWQACAGGLFGGSSQLSFSGCTVEKITISANIDETSEWAKAIAGDFGGSALNLMTEEEAAPNTSAVEDDDMADIGKSFTRDFCYTLPAAVNGAEVTLRGCVSNNSYKIVYEQSDQDDEDDEVEYYGLGFEYQMVDADGVPVGELVSVPMKEQNTFVHTLSESELEAGDYQYRSYFISELESDPDADQWEKRYGEWRYFRVDGNDYDNSLQASCEDNGNDFFLTLETGAVIVAGAKAVNQTCTFTNIEPGYYMLRCYSVLHQDGKQLLFVGADKPGLQKMVKITADGKMEETLVNPDNVLSQGDKTSFYQMDYAAGKLNVNGLISDGEPVEENHSLEYSLSVAPDNDSFDLTDNFDGDSQSFSIGVERTKLVTEKIGGTEIKVPVETATVNELTELIDIYVSMAEVSLGEDEQYAVYRQHDGEVQQITALPNAAGEYFEVNDELNYLILHVKKFSTYAFGTEPKPEKPRQDGSRPTFAPPAEDEQPLLWAGYGDVVSGDWYYDDVRQLALAGVIDGYPDGSFRPQATLSGGEALKLILRAGGYGEQSAVGGHWAEGYRNRALSDGLLDADLPLDQPIDRLSVAHIVAKLLQLEPTTAAGVFGDCNDGYVNALHAAGIIQGSYDPSGQLVFKPGDSITRAEICAVILRIYNYIRQQ